MAPAYQPRVARHFVGPKALGPKAKKAIIKKKETNKKKLVESKRVRRGGHG
ncbi:hypothetical protein FE257_006528 [Aspergillus nanangensis]|uniref:Uncharacterized protein n=1 Tax=Aspergillus nanangensis TaxID=2582783 RepID=A0AAD4GZD5_ASPNN|nr:hypothetical protein FE257_006528 [Aspergillus nanangensis]